MINYFVFDTNSLISAHLLADSVSAKAFEGIPILTAGDFLKWSTL
jgi:hypothetical protein